MELKLENSLIQEISQTLFIFVCYIDKYGTGKCGLWSYDSSEYGFILHPRCCNCHLCFPRSFVFSCP